jgi:hypothetical protein
MSHQDAQQGASCCDFPVVRTTISLDPDTEVIVQQVRERDGVGLSEAVNSLIRAASINRKPASPYVHKSVAMGARVDVANIGDVLDFLDS